MNGFDELAASVVASHCEDAAVNEKLRLHVADTLGAWVAATATPEGKALIAFRRELQSLPGGGGYANLLDDVALHCGLVRLSEADDIHLASMITPGSIVIPAAFILAARLNMADVAALAAAILGGYEAMIRLGLAIDGPAILYRGIWPTYFAAAFGTAAVTARLLPLSERQTAHALALALTMSAPSVGQHHAATTARWLSVGHAARNGVSAALAARAGFTADLDLMRSQFMSGIYGIEPDLAAMTETSGGRPALAEVSFKPWCAARQTMAATQALCECAKSGVMPEQITQITAAVLPPHFKMINHGVKAGDRASFMTSLPYQMAVALVQPEARFTVSPSVMPSPALQALMARITVTEDDSLLPNYPAEWSARVTLVTAQGRHEKLVRHVPGDPALPMSDASLKEKFHRLVAPVLGETRASPLWHSATQALFSEERARHLVQELDRIVEGAVVG